MPSEDNPGFIELQALPVYQRQLVISKLYDSNKLYGELCVFILQNDTDPICKWYAIKAAGENHFWECVDLLVDVLFQENSLCGESSLHRIAAYAFGKLGANVIPMLIPCLNSGNTDTMSAVFDAFGELKSPLAIPYIIPIFKSSYNAAIVYAGLALAKIGSPSVPYIKEVISDANLNNLMVLVDALTSINTLECREILLQTFIVHPDILLSLCISMPRGFASFVDYVRCKISDSEQSSLILPLYYLIRSAGGIHD